MTSRAIDERPATDAAEPSEADLAAGQRRVMLALAVAPFLGALTFAAPAPFFPEMARDLDASVPALGQAITAMLLLSAVLALVAGPLADRYGYRRLMVLGAIAASICLLGFGLAPVYLVLLGVALVGGIGDATLPNLSFAVAGTVFTGAARRRAIGVATAALAGSAVIGVPLLTGVGAIAGWRVPFVLAGLAGLAAVWLIATALPDDHRRADSPLRLDTLLAAYRPLLRHRPTLRFYGATILRAICWFGLLTYFGAFLGEELDLGTAWIGVVYMLGGGGYVAGSLVAERLLARVPARSLVAAMNVVMALTMGLIFSSILATLATVALLPIAGFAGAVGWVGVATLLVEETPAGLGTTMALNSALFNLGAAGGGAVGGLSLALAGYGALSLTLPIFAFAAALLIWRPPRVEPSLPVPVPPVA